MWTITILVGLVAAAIIAVAVAVSRRPAPPDPHEQPPVEAATTGSLPDPGSHETARRHDGTLMPGSEEYRNRQGRR